MSGGGIIKDGNVLVGPLVLPPDAGLMQKAGKSGMPPSSLGVFLASGLLSALFPPHSQPRALRHTTVLSNIMFL